MNYNKQFLKLLDQDRNKIIYCRITALSINDDPLEIIEGRISGGSINIDGTSAVRRSCSLTMVSENVDINNYYWGYKTKFNLEIGVKNTIDKNYPDIIWFPQGVFIITSFSTALSSTNYTINLQGKDKMCLLNGDIGGSITASTRFDIWEHETEDGQWKKEKYAIKDIIRDAVHQFAGEPMHNIIINDLDELGLQTLEYRYDTPLFLLREVEDDTYTMGTLNGKTEFTYYAKWDPEIDEYIERDQGTTLAGDEDVSHTYDSLLYSLEDQTKPTIFINQIDKDKDGVVDQELRYCAAKIEFGDTAGFRQTELIYNEELTGNVGESITSILDKITTKLGIFEYFYDLDGRFIFQRKADYAKTVWTPIVQNEDDTAYVDMGVKQYAYEFHDGELITAFNNTPNLNNLRNDYSVWGARKGAQDVDIPIHMRYAIDKKPIYYKAYDTIDQEGNPVPGVSYCTQEYPDAEVEVVDWREIIFQMQKDYRKHNHDDDFEIKLIQNNMPIPEIGFNGYLNGRTGYEQYYVDVEGFWRQLYYPKFAYEEKYASMAKKIEDKTNEYNEITNDETLKKSLKEEIDKLQQELDDFVTDYQETYYPEDHSNKFWNKQVFESPHLLNYWLDFLDTEGELDKFSCQAIGNRPKAINDTNIKSIYYRETPNIIFAVSSEMQDMNKKTGYRYFQSPDIDNMFSPSGQGISAKDKIDELIYQHSYSAENVSITSIPIYYLQPNSRIYIKHNQNGIDGDYIVTRLTIPLTYNGTMSITATKAVQYM